MQSRLINKSASEKAVGIFAVGFLRKNSSQLINDTR